MYTPSGGKGLVTETLRGGPARTDWQRGQSRLGAGKQEQQGLIT